MKKINKRKILIPILSSVLCVSAGVAFACMNDVNASAEGTNEYITGASLTLSGDIAVNYRVANIPEGYTTATMTYTYKGETYQEEKAIDSATELTFSFDKVTPQQMTTAVDATITFSGEGLDAISETHAGFTVADYCNSVLSRDPSSLGYEYQHEYDAMKSFVADLLNFGAKAQEYRGVNTDALATDVLNVAQAGAMTEFVAPTESDYSQTGTVSNIVRWKSATLRYDDNVDVVFNVYVKEALLEGKAVSLLVQKDGEDAESITAFEKSSYNDEVSVYTFVYENLSVTEFDKVMTVNAQLDGANEGKTLTYSVKTYVYNILADENASESMKNLAKATYTYGKSAVSYNEAQETLPAVKPVVDTTTTYYQPEANNFGDYVVEIDAKNYSHNYKTEMLLDWGAVAGYAFLTNAVYHDGYIYAVAGNAGAGIEHVITEGDATVTTYYRSVCIAKIDAKTMQVVGKSATYHSVGGRNGLWSNVEGFHSLYVKDGVVYTFDKDKNCLSIGINDFTAAGAALTGVTSPLTIDNPGLMRGIYVDETNGKYAVLQGSNIMTYAVGATTATKTFAVGSSIKGSATRMTADENYIYVLFAADDIETPIIKIFDWEGNHVSTAVVPTGRAVHGGNNADMAVKYLTLIDGEMYFGMINWKTGTTTDPGYDAGFPAEKRNKTAIFKVTTGDAISGRLSLIEAIEGGHDVTVVDSTVLNWGSTGGSFIYNSTTDGEYLYLARGTLSSGKGNLGVQKVDVENNAIVATSATVPAYEAATSAEAVAIFYKDGYIYIAGDDTTTTDVVDIVWYKVPVDFTASSTPEKAEVVAFMDDSDTEIAPSKIYGVYWDETEEKFAVLVGSTVYVCNEDGTFVKKFTAGNIPQLATYAGGAATGSTKRVAGANGRIYVSAYAQGTKEPAFNMYDFNGVWLGQMRLPNASSGQTDNSSKMEALSEVNGSIYFSALRWGSGSQAYVGKVDYVNGSASDTRADMTFGEYYQTSLELGVEPTYIINPLVESGGLGLGTAYVHGSTTDGRYDYYTTWVNTPQTGIRVYKVLADTAIVAGYTTLVNAKISNATFHGHLFYKDGYVYVTDEGTLYRIATADIGKADATFEKVTDIVANVGAVKAGAYSEAKNAYAFTTATGALYIVDAEGTVVANNADTVNKVTGLTCDDYYIYSLSECEAGAGQAIIRIFDWSGNLIAKNVVVGGLEPSAESTNNNVQSMFIRDGKVYFVTCAWGDGCTHVYNVDFDFTNWG